MEDVMPGHEEYTDSTRRKPTKTLLCRSRLPLWYIGPMLTTYGQGPAAIIQPGSSDRQANKANKAKLLNLSTLSTRPHGGQTFGDADASID